MYPRGEFENPGPLGGPTRRSWFYPPSVGGNYGQFSADPVGDRVGLSRFMGQPATVFQSGTLLGVIVFRMDFLGQHAKVVESYSPYLGFA